MNRGYPGRLNITPFTKSFYLRNIKDGLDNSNFGKLSQFINKLTVLPHSTHQYKEYFHLKKQTH